MQRSSSILMINRYNLSINQMLSQTALNQLCDFSHKHQRQLSDITEQDLNSSSSVGLVKSFKQMRQKIKICNKQNSGVKEQLRLKDISMAQMQQSMEQLVVKNMQLQDNIARVNKNNEELVKKVNLCKQSIQHDNNLEQQISFLRGAMLDMKITNDRFQTERSQLLQALADDKLTYQSQINQLNAKIASQKGIIQQCQVQNQRLKQKNMKLQNQVKKMQINYDQQQFQRQWSTDNFQTQHLRASIKQLQAQADKQQGKYLKLKQKKSILQQQLIALQQQCEFTAVKAEIYEGQLEVLNEKYQQLQKKSQQYKAKHDKIYVQHMDNHNTVDKLIALGEELAALVKRKGNASVDFSLKELVEKLNQFKHKTNHPNTDHHSQTKSRHNLPQRSASCFREQSLSPSSPKKLTAFTLTQTLKFASQPPQTYKDKNIKSSGVTFGEPQISDDQEGAKSVENRILKERCVMQKKIREKIIQRKIETANPNEQYRLRNQYIKSYLDKSYS